MRTSLIGIAISFALFSSAAQAQTPSFSAAGIVNYASHVAGNVAPGMVAQITGSNLGDPNFFRNCASTTPITTTCSGISVLVNGTPAPVFNNSSTSVVFQVPFNVSGSTASIQVTSNLSGATVSSSPVSVPVVPTSPGLFSVDGSGKGTGYYYVNTGLTIKYSQATQAGDTVVFFGTGFGVTTPAVAAGATAPSNAAAAATTVKVNGISVPVTFSGLSPAGTPGYDEVVFTVPKGLVVPTGQTEGSYPVVVTIGGVDSPAVNIRVATPPPDISSVTPSPVPLSGNPQTVTFNGSGFQTGLSVKLSTSGSTVTLKSPDVTFLSSTQITVKMTTGTQAGTWYATAINPDGGQSPTFQFQASGTVSGPTITSVVTTSSQATVIAQNTWLEVHGVLLATAGTATDWSSWDFTHKGLPTTLAGVSATVNGKAAAIFYVSPTQVNILAPIDTAVGSVAVQLNTPNGQTAIFPVTEQLTSPAFFVIDTPGHVAALHLDYSLLGPPLLNAPGYTFTPAKPGETVVLYATGFGQTTPPVADQLHDTGMALPTQPTISIGGTPAQVIFGGISAAGLYQFNVVVPPGTPDGDATLTASYNGISTPQGVVLTVHH